MRTGAAVLAIASVSTPSATVVSVELVRRLFWTLDRLKSGKPLRASDLTRELEVSMRTAYRDLDLLRDDWHVALEYDRHQGTYRLTGPVGSLPLVSLSQGELLAIYFPEKVVRQYRGTPLEDDLASAFAKMLERGREPLLEPAPDPPEVGVMVVDPRVVEPRPSPVTNATRSGAVCWSRRTWSG